MKTRTKVILAVCAISFITSLIITIGGAIMVQMKTPFDIFLTKDFTGKKVKRENWVKNHEVDIKNYILAGLSDEEKGNIEDIRVNVDSWKNIYDEGAAGFGATGKYDHTKLSYDVKFKNFPEYEKYTGNFTLAFDIDTKNDANVPLNEEQSAVISGVRYTGKGISQLWKQPKVFKNKTNLIGGGTINE